ncbi:hypothetical protein H0Z60_04900 [Ectothiorhodospiraceae bacterium WFHF3C12]|nr:hypothetical protein [Ectothiorhodospiraceae bacterium WFHF3C12]
MMRLDPPRKPGAGPLREPDPDEDEFFLMHLQVLESLYFKDGSPVHAMDAIIFAYDAGIVPPTWAMDWLVPAFREYTDAEGQVELPHLLGLGSQGKGRAPPVRKFFADAQRRYKAQLVHILTVAFSVPIQDAAVMVWARENGVEDDPDGRRAGWLAEQYSRKWRKEFDKEAREGIDVTEMYVGHERSPEWRKEFIESFPSELLPPGLK